MLIIHINWIPDDNSNIILTKYFALNEDYSLFILGSLGDAISIIVLNKHTNNK